MIPICGERVENFMMECGFSQDQLATEALINKDTIGKIIAAGSVGKRCQPRVAKAIAKALGGISVSQIRVPSVPEGDIKEAGDAPASPRRTRIPKGVEWVVPLMRRKLVPGTLTMLGEPTQHRLAETAEEIDMLGVNLNVTWFDDRDFVEVLKARIARKKRPKIRILLPSPRCTLLKIYARWQAHVLDNKGVLTRYEETRRMIESLGLQRSLKLFDSIGLYSGVVRLGRVLFLSTYMAHTRGSNGPTFIATQEDAPELYEAVRQDFDDLWKRKDLKNAYDE